MSPFKPLTHKHVHRRNFLKGVAAASAVPAFAVGASRPTPPPWSAISSPDNDEAYWRLIRSCLLLEPGYNYLNNGTQGPMPMQTLEAMDKTAHACASDPWVWGKVWEGINKGIPRMAKFIGAENDEVALTYNTTDGMNAIIQGLMMKEGDEVLISDQEHPSGVAPFQRRVKHDGIVINTFKTEKPPSNPSEVIDAVEAAITPRTRLLFLSHLGFMTGLLTPVVELCELARSKGVLTLLDGAHPLGMINLDMKKIGCDFYAASGFKWIMGPEGTGVLYVRKDVLDQVDPLVVSSNWDNNERGALKFMSRGSLNVIGFTGLLASMRFQEKIGKEKIENRVRYLSTRLRSGLAEIPGVKLYTSNDPKLSAALTSFSIGELEHAAVLAAFNEHYSLFPRTIRNFNAIRISTHIYNTEEEVDRCIIAAKEIATKGLPDVSAAALRNARSQIDRIESFCA